MFTSDSQHPPRSKHAVYLGDFTVKTAQLPPLWVLTYTYFYSENSSAATSGVNLHIFYSENRPAATSLGVNSLPPSVVCW